MLRKIANATAVAVTMPFVGLVVVWCIVAAQFEAHAASLRLKSYSPRTDPELDIAR